MAREPQDTTAAQQAHAADPGTGASGDAPPDGKGRRAVFRVPGPALLAVFLLLVCVVPVATALPGLQVLFILPLGLALWIVRTRTTATRQGLTVRTVLGTRELPWEALKGVSITPKSKVNAVLSDESTVPLPAVRARHLPVISLVSEGRLPDPSGILDKPGKPGQPSTEAPDGATGTTEATEEPANTGTDSDDTTR